MKKSKLIDLLATFSNEDWRSFDDFVRSPYFNKKKELLPLVDYLRSCAPLFKDRAVSKERILKKVTLPKGDPEKQLNMLGHYLLKLGEEFVGMREYQRSSLSQSLDSLRGLVNRRLEKHYRFNLRKLEKSIETVDKSDESYFLGQYHLAALANKLFQKKDERRFDQNIQNEADHLDYWYFGKKLKLLCEMSSRGQLFNRPYRLSHVDELLHCVEQTDTSATPFILGYYHVQKMQRREDDEKHFEALKDLFQSQLDSFSLEDQKDLLSHILNYCIRQVRERSEKKYFMEEALRLYLFGVDHEILLENEILSPWHYKNIVKLGINLNRFAWVEQFIFDYAPLLEESTRENALHFNLADLHYFQKNYDVALENLNKVNFTDVHYQLNSRVMLAQIFYEQDEEELLISQLASFNVFLHRNKNISSSLGKTYSNFCKLLNALLRRNPKKYPRILEEIKTTSPLTSRQWLLNVYEKEKKSVC